MSKKTRKPMKKDNKEDSFIKNRVSENRIIKKIVKSNRAKKKEEEKHILKEAIKTWQTVGFKKGRVNPIVAKMCITKIYRQVNHTAPSIVETRSPFEANCIIHLLKQIKATDSDHALKSTEDQDRQQRSLDRRDKLRSRLMSQIGKQLYSVTREKIQEEQKEPLEQLRLTIRQKLSEELQQKQNEEQEQTEEQTEEQEKAAKAAQVLQERTIERQLDKQVEKQINEYIEEKINKQLNAKLDSHKRLTTELWDGLWGNVPNELQIHLTTKLYASLWAPILESIRVQLLSQFPDIFHQFQKHQTTDLWKDPWVELCESIVGQLPIEPSGADVKDIKKQVNQDLGTYIWSRFNTVLWPQLMVSIKAHLKLRFKSRLWGSSRRADKPGTTKQPEEILSPREKLGRQLDSQLKKRLNSRFKNHFREHLGNRQGDRVGDLVWVMFEEELFVELYDILDDYLYDYLWGELGDTFRDKLETSLCAEFKDNAKNAYQDLSSHVAKQLDGKLYTKLHAQSKSNSKLSLLDTAAVHVSEKLREQTEAVGVDYEAPLFTAKDIYTWGRLETATELGALLMDDQRDQLNSLIDVSKSCGNLFPFDSICFICDSPTIRSDDSNNLHSEKGPSVEYSDGFKIYSLNGVYVPASITP